MRWVKVNRSDNFIQKSKKAEKTNHQPVSLLSHISKVFWIEPFLSKVPTRFRKNHNTHHSLLKVPENFKWALDKGNLVNGIVTDLSKTVSTPNNELLTFKLEVYGFPAKTLSYIHNSLNKRL